MNEVYLLLVFITSTIASYLFLFYCSNWKTINSFRSGFVIVFVKAAVVDLKKKN
jgi:hypothetical protein